jgi:serine/threonine protein kinase
MILGNYTLLEKLGEGGMATVHLAVHNKLNIKVAIKLLNDEYFINKNIRHRFSSEAQSMANMTHLGIVKVLDLIETPNNIAIVMEYVDGSTLKEYIEFKGKLTDLEINDFFTQMLDAVGYVHKNNLIHRDIKPSNFMINKEGQCKLMDFGIAKNMDPNADEFIQTGTGIQMGTPMYMSPEQITETKSVTFQSDIYSLGVVLWQMVTGKKPYDIKTLSNFQLQSKIVHEPLPFTNTKWDNIIQKATTKNLDSRFQNCIDFMNILIFEVNHMSNGRQKNDSSDITVIQTGGSTPIEPPKPESAPAVLAALGVIIILYLLFSSIKQ